MPKKKCPACGSTNTIPIMYGMPAFDAMEAEERGEIALGGCCITDNQPQRHCRECNTDFNYTNMIGTFPIQYLEFSVGGFFGTSHFVYFDSTYKNNIVRYASLDGGMFIDLKHPKSKNNEYVKNFINERILSDVEWQRLMDEIEKLEIPCWRKKYVNLEICDGTQWSLNLKVTGMRKIRLHGSNEYPPFWNKLIKILSNYIGENIE